MRKGIVDRIINGYARIEWEDRTMDNLPVASFSGSPKEGDLFVWENGEGRLLPDETEKRKQRIQTLFDQLKKESE